MLGINLGEALGADELAEALGSISPAVEAVGVARVEAGITSSCGGIGPRKAHTYI